MPSASLHKNRDTTFGTPVVALRADLAAGAVSNAGLAVLLPLPRLLEDFRAAACSALARASASAFCATATQVLLLITR